MGKERDKETKEAACMQTHGWSVCLLCYGLCQVSSVCPVFSLTSISISQREWTLFLACMSVCGGLSASNWVWITSHKGPHAWGASSWVG